MRKLTSSLVLAFALCTAALAGKHDDGEPAPVMLSALSLAELSALTPPPAVPHMPADMALANFQQRAAAQRHDLAGYSAHTDIAAELPDTAQKGDFELEREFTAPGELRFKPVRYTGDGFVKSNVITRLLQSEVDHTSHDTGDTAINATNYKFSYKGTESLGGRDMHVFQVKPRHKVAGLFKGKIYVDAMTGTLRRAEGTVVKSPSFFIKKIEFVQDYCDVGSFTLPLRTRSTAVTRIIGRAVVNILHRDYQARATSGAVVTDVDALDLN